MSESPHWLRWTARLGLLAATIVLSLIMLGVFDPKPVGSEKWRLQLAPHQVPARTQQIYWLDQALPEQDYSLRLTATYRSGDPDTGYGLVIGRDSHFLAAAVSSLGYVAIWEQSQEPGSGQAESMFILPWQTWPHIQNSPASNEIWLDRRRDQITIRVNRELLWQGYIGGLSGDMGLLAESFGETALIDYLDLQLFAD